MCRDSHPTSRWVFNSRSTRAETFPIDESLSPRVLGRIAAALYVLCGGLVALVGPLLPSMRGTNRLGLAITGAIAAVVGAVVWQLPWDRWSRSATLWLVPLSFALIGVHNHFTNETLACLPVNEAAVAHYGYSRDDFLAMTIEDIRPAEDVPALRASFAAGAEVTGGERLWRHRRRDGSTIEVEVRGHALQFAGRDARLVLCQDVTDRRLAEAALRESEERFRSLVQNAHDVVVLVDENARARYVSPAIPH